MEVGNRLINQYEMCSKGIHCKMETKSSLVFLSFVSLVCLFDAPSLQMHGRNSGERACLTLTLSLQKQRNGYLQPVSDLKMTQSPAYVNCPQNLSFLSNHSSTAEKA